MQDAAAGLANKINEKKDDDRKDLSEAIALDRRYGEIGISAVAAAVRYQGSGKNPAYAPTSNKWRDSVAGEAA
jgi:hypothetical protein